MKLKLIETWLPLEALAQAAANEQRAGKGTPASLHLWWGNRQVALARGLLFAQLVDAPDFGERGKLRQIRDVLVGLLNGDARVEPLARRLVAESCGDAWPKVHDPFCGIGTVPFAALSLGIPAAGGDLNPVAAFVTRLAIGGTRSRVDEPSVRRAIVRVGAKLRAAVAADYPAVKVTPSMAKDRPGLAKYVGRTLPVEMWLWCRTVPDPNPAFAGLEVPLLTTFVTGAKTGSETWLEPVLLKTRRDFVFRVHEGAPPREACEGTRCGARGFRSLVDAKVIAQEYVREQAKAGRLGRRMVAVFVSGDGGEHVVLSVTPEQVRAAEAASAGEDIPLPALPPNPRDMTPVNYGARTYADLFLPRQRRMLTKLGEIICEEARAGETGCDVARVLTLAFSTFLSWHSTANTYWNQRQFPRNAFVRQKINQTWDFVEANPVEASLKRWDVIASATADAFFALPPVPCGTAVACDAGTWTESESDPVVCHTELPYYDNVAYADLADFFYGWIRPCLQAVDPDLARSMASPRTEELTAFAYRHGGPEKADRFYRLGLAAALANLEKQQRADYPAVFGFDFRSAFLSDRDLEPITSFVEGLVEAGFVITATWPLKDIRAKAVFGGAAGSGYRSIYFVCRKAEGLRREPIARREFVALLEKRLNGGLETYRALDRNLDSADYAYAAVGTGLRYYTEYEKVLSADGSVFAAREAVTEVMRIVKKIEADERCDSERSSAERACVAFRAELKETQNPDALYRKVYAAYEKAEAEGREEDARIYNGLLNQWNQLLEEEK